MKKTFYLFFLLICLLLCCGCNNKVKCEINEYRGGIYPEEEPSYQNDYKSIYDILGYSGCYFFENYTEFDDFLSKNGLMISEKIESKYSEEFFIDKSLIIYFEVDGSPGYKYTFKLKNKENILKLEISKSIDERYDYACVEVDRMFFIDINKEEIENTTEFVFSRNIAKQWWVKL